MLSFDLFALSRATLETTRDSVVSDFEALKKSKRVMSDELKVLDITVARIGQLCLELIEISGTPAARAAGAAFAHKLRAKLLNSEFSQQVELYRTFSKKIIARRATSSIMDALPYELMSRASDFLPRKDRFRFLISLPVEQRKGYLIANKSLVSDIIASVKGDLNRLPLYLQAAMKSREILKTVTNLPRECRVADENAEVIVTTFPFLKAIYCYEITDKSFALITTHLKGLEKLSISSGTITSLQGIHNLTRLQQLHMYDCNQLTDQGLEAIGGHKSLQSLILSANSLTNKSAAIIGQIPGLQTLRIHSPTANFLSLLPPVKELTQLSCLSFDASVPDVTDQIVVSLPQKFPKLEELVVDCSNISDKGIAGLTALKKLQRLYTDFSGSAVTAAGVRALAIGLPHLVLLSIGGISDDSIGHLVHMKGLQKLTLGRSANLTSKGVALLATCPQLTVLNIICNGRMEGTDFTNLIDTMIENPHALPNLKEFLILNLRLADQQVVEAKCDQLEKVRPKMKVRP